MTPPRRRLGRALLVAPALAPVLVVVGTGATATALQSTGLMPLVGRAAPTLDAFHGAAADQDLVRSAALSLALAGVSAVLAVAVGFLVAVVVLDGGVGGRLVRVAAVATIPVPHVVGAASIGLLLSDSGLVARLTGTGAGGMPQLVAGPWWVATVAEYAWKESAFVAVVVLASLAARHGELAEVATSLGARPAHRLRRLTLPLAAPSLVATGGIAFAYALGSYEVPWLLGRTAPEPLPVLAYRLLTDLDLTTRPQAAAVGMVTIAVAVVVLAGTAALLRTTPRSS